MTVEAKGAPPFNTMIGAAVNDCRENEGRLREEHSRAPERWQAFRLASYWDGAVSLAIMKPDSLDVEQMVVTSGGRSLELASGPGIVPALSRHHVDSLEIESRGSSVVVAVEKL